MMTTHLARRPSRFGIAAALLASILPVACGRSPGEPTYTGSAFDSLVVTLSSTLAVGRTVRPTLAVEHRTVGPVHESTSEIDAATRFESSNPTILSVIAGGGIRANAVGRATITAQLADRRTSVVVDVIPGFAASYVDGTDGLTVIGVNDAGDVIGTTATGGGVLVRQGAVTDLGPCRPRAINNAAQVACVVTLPCVAPCYRVTPGLYDAGVLTTPFDTVFGDGSGITELGALFGKVRGADGLERVFVRTSAGVTYRSTVAANWRGTTHTINSALNGLTVYQGTLYSSSAIVRASSATGLGPDGGRWSHAFDINDADDVVGTAERRLGRSGVGGTATIWRASRNWTPENPSYRAADARAISEAGHVVGSGEDGPYVWRDGRYTILTDALADAGWTLSSAPSISRNGKVAAIGRHTSGMRGLVLIDLGAGF